uniref:HDC07239 n=1 Tax=Drosophila melanogaster TaxID=7227 RepID=Q6IG48_DROME|nr:TPA_inf: HDC07239 [Drosophila melanogaster]
MLAMFVDQPGANCPHQLLIAAVRACVRSLYPYLYLYLWTSAFVSCYQLSVKNLFHFSTSFSADLRPCRDASNIYCHKKRRGYRSIEFGFGFGLQ